MAIPNGAAGIDTANGIFLVSADGNGDVSPAGLTSQDQANAVAKYKAKYLDGGNSVWSDIEGALGQAVAGLESDLNIFVAVLKVIANALGLSGVWTTVEHVGDAIGDWWNSFLNDLLHAPETIIGNIGNVVVDTVDTIQNWLDSLNSAFGGSGAGKKVSDVAAQAGVVTGTANDASNGATNANAGVQQIRAQLSASTVAGGVFVSDLFSYATASALPNPPYVKHEYGAGSGQYRPTNGTLAGNSTGSSADRTILYADTTNPLTTDNGYVTASVYKYTDGQPFYLIGRDDGAAGTCVRAQIQSNAVEIQSVSSGNTFTTVGSSASVALHSGDVWEFWFGTLADATLLWVVQNGNVRISPISDTLHTIGSGHRCCGVGGKLKGLGGIAGQQLPPSLHGITFADQDAP